MYAQDGTVSLWICLHTLWSLSLSFLFLFLCFYFLAFSPRTNIDVHVQTSKLEKGFVIFIEKISPVWILRAEGKVWTCDDGLGNFCENLRWMHSDPSTKGHLQIENDSIYYTIRKWWWMHMIFLDYVYELIKRYPHYKQQMENLIA